MRFQTGGDRGQPVQGTPIEALQSNGGRAADDAGYSKHVVTSLDRRIEAMARMEALYQDSERRKWSRQSSEEMTGRSASSYDDISIVSGGWSQYGGWKERHGEIVGKWHADRARREERRLRELADRQEEEVQACSFRPKLIAKPKKQVKKAATSSGLESSLHKALEEEHRAHERAARDAHHHGWDFLRSHEGKKALSERMAAYAAENPGLSSAAVRREAMQDIMDHLADKRQERQQTEMSFEEISKRTPTHNSFQF